MYPETTVVETEKKKQCSQEETHFTLPDFRENMSYALSGDFHLPKQTQAYYVYWNIKDFILCVGQIQDCPFYGFFHILRISSCF